MGPYFNSRDKHYKDPFGAVPCGAEVRFALADDTYYGCELLVLREFAGTEDTCALPPAEGGFAGTYTAPAGGELCWYCFRLTDVDGRCVWYGKNGVQDAPEKAARWQLTVYEPSPAPDWFGRGVTYQIFPDRFRRVSMPDVSHMPGHRWLHRGWNEQPVSLPDEHGQITNRDFFGGSLQGITEKLDYLAGLGVTTLYLNPIFEAASNHRYDTGDYRDIDPLLGTEADFRALCTAAHQRGMRVILDGVFNHTGSNSRYFNAEGYYPEPGAAQSQNSEYYSWYSFHPWPSDYDAWWGVKTLPAVNEAQPAYRDFIFGDQDSVVRHWLRCGADGWRLDVADELPMPFLRELRRQVKDVSKDAAVLGEVWEDASHKVAYGQMRSYVLGDTLDSVMNYPLRDALIAFLMAQKDAAAVAKELSSLAQNYPKPFLYALMNLMGSHDRPRILNVLAGNDGSDIPRSQRAGHRLSREERMIGALREQLMLRFMFSVPGMPCIYYGDEAGVEGCADPFCRRTYPWGREDQDMLARYKAMAAMRNGHPVLKTGDCAYIAPCSAVLGVIRKNENGKDAFGKKAENACAVTLINRSAREVVVYLTSADVSGAQTLVSDDGQIFTARSGAFSVKIKGLQGMTMFAM